VPTAGGPDALFAQAEKVGGAPAATSGNQTQAAASTSEKLESMALSSFLLLAILWGIITLLMPCTYPMIPITMSFFTKQAIARNGKVLPLALLYGAGIVAIFVLIGVLLGAPIIRFATHPITNLVIGALFFVFALALFGMINLQPPAFLQRAAGKASQTGGYLGVFLMGATLVVTSFTCTAPFVGSLLSIGAGGGADTGRIALGMGVFGLTMATPFVALALVPGKLQQMPRAGEWMHVIKVFLGFVELAAALKFISNADITWQWGLLSREVFLVLWTGIFLAAAAFLFGWIRLEGEQGQHISPLRMVVGVFSLLSGLYFGLGSQGYVLDDITTAIVPNYSSPRLGGGGAGGGQQSGHTIIKDDLPAALARARAEDKLLLINFTGFT
jgi:thiol:disulfide interchange protein DsbD